MREKIVPSLGEAVGMAWKNLQSRYTKEKIFYVAAPLSSTPLPIYQWVIDHAESFPNWNKVRFVLMDEQLEGDQPPFSYVPSDDSASYEGFAKKNFLGPLSKKVPIIAEVIKPESSQIEEFDTEIDLLILAIGVRGNYANVMPGTPAETGWHVAHLLPEFNQYHEASSYTGSHFREFGMSLGPQQVLNAKNIVVIISGEKKKELTTQLKGLDHFDPEFPLSIIYHPKIRDRVEVYLTPDTL